MLRWLLPLVLLSVGCSDYEVENLLKEEVFTQAEDPPGDVLFVVDNSASMTEEQARLSENFGRFLELLGSTTADYRIGVTTTDPSQGGVLVGPVLTGDTADVVAAFSAQVNVGTSGSRDEAGLEMAALAMRTSVNPDFLREEGIAHLVFVSDEDDHSIGEVSTWLTAFDQAAIGEGVVAHALVGDEPQGCFSGASAADAGSRYLAAASALGGLRESICADDYGVVLEEIGLAVSGYNPLFSLEAIPARATLRVWVDGVEIVEREADGWTYSLGDNAIVFSGWAIPRPGMQVRVTYQRA